MQETVTLVSLAFFVPKMLGNVRFFLKNLKWRAPNKHSFENLMGTVFTEKILCSVFRFLTPLFQAVKKWELRIPRFYESSGLTGKYSKIFHQLNEVIISAEMTLDMIRLSSKNLLT
jgi:hypothetical protein